MILQSLGAIFVKSNHVGRLFIAKVFINFAQISTDFAWIFRNISLIFTKSKLLGVCLHPLPLHHCTNNYNNLAYALFLLFFR